MLEDNILFSYEFDHKGGAKPLQGKEITRKIKSKSLAWVHMDANHPATEAWLKNELSYLDPYIIEALLAEETRPRMTQINDGMILILRGVNLNEGADPEDMVSLRIWIDPNRIISVRRRKLRAVLDLEKSLQKGSGPKSVGDFVCMLITNLFNRTSPVLSKLDDDTDSVEEAILDTVDENLREQIVQVRKKAIMFRRYIAPQREAIAKLKMSDISWLTEENKRFLQEGYNQISIYVEDLDAIRERSQIVKDELANVIATQMNKNMYVISVIAAIFLPLGFLTGLLGTNFSAIPFADAPNAFWIFCGLMFGIVGIQIALFKKFKWF